MNNSQDWLIRPENYRALQNIRKRIRSVYGEDIRITKADDVQELFRYQNGSDEAINRMLEDFENRSPKTLKNAYLSERSREAGPLSSKRVYRGQVMPA